MVLGKLGRATLRDRSSFEHFGEVSVRREKGERLRLLPVSVYSGYELRALRDSGEIGSRGD
jgi:hypothetical protein